LEKVNVSMMFVKLILWYRLDLLEICTV